MHPKEPANARSRSAQRATYRPPRWTIRLNPEFAKGWNNLGCCLALAPRDRKDRSVRQKMTERRKEGKINKTYLGLLWGCFGVQKAFLEKVKLFDTFSYGLLTPIQAYHKYTASREAPRNNLETWEEWQKQCFLHFSVPSRSFSFSMSGRRKGVFLGAEASKMNLNDGVPWHFSIREVRWDLQKAPLFYTPASWFCCLGDFLV